MQDKGNQFDLPCSDEKRQDAIKRNNETLHPRLAGRVS